MKRPIPTPLAAALIGLCALVLSTGCQVDVEAFHQRLFSCNPSAKEPGCGTDREGQPMVCVAAQQLGGPNFCSESCDRAVVPVDGNETVACQPAGPLSSQRLSGAALKKCNPAIPDACGHPELSCLRTDLMGAEGVCMTLSPCQTNADCRDPVRSVCMGELIQSTYPGASLQTDHTYCVQFGCRADGTACSPGEVCLRNVVVKESKPSDICVPNCDSNDNCPPNYFCFRKLYSSISPNVCIPGLLGLRCESKMDCLFGDCVDTGAGFNMCTVACQSDSDCAKYDGEHGTFFCNAAKYCAGSRAFKGPACDVDANCRPGEICARITPLQSQGFCLLPCVAGGCPAFGGVNHMCVPQVDGTKAPVCWPGELGVPCLADVQCIGGLACQKAPGQQVGLCTTLCRSDDDCLKQRFAREGYCELALNVCLPPRRAGRACETNQQCESKNCVVTASDNQGNVTARACAEIPGY